MRKLIYPEGKIFGIVDIHFGKRDIFRKRIKGDYLQGKKSSLRGIGGVIKWMAKESKITGQMRCKPCWILINNFKY